MTRANDCHYVPGWVTALMLSLGMLMLALTVGCRRGVPVVNVGAEAPAARLTITGLVRGSEGTTAIAGRTVEIVNTSTNEEHTVQTGGNGGFAIELPAGEYRLELPLHGGETLVKRPGIVTLDKRDIDSHIEFLVGPARVSRPRGPSYRVDNGLGSPIA
jgi:hypothetical protein